MKSYRRLAPFLMLSLNGLLASKVGLASQTALMAIPVATGLNSPVSIQNAGDGSGRLFVAERDGTIRIIRDGALMATPYLDISDRVVREGEGGLVGLVFHPQYADNGRFFVVYTTRDGETIEWVLSEFRAQQPQGDQAATDEKVLLRVERPNPIHFGGDLAFGPDGYLYISSGDGGEGAPAGRAQDLSTLLGKILRIDVNSPDEPYAIPADNPFLGTPDARGEIWAYGLRNPFRMAFDRLTGRLFAGDVGEGRFEEIDIVLKGGNYGWGKIEGTHCFPGPDEGCGREGTILPIHDYGRVDGSAVIGGRVYRGPQAGPDWGSYVFADFVQGRIWALRERGTGQWERRQLLKTQFLISALGEDQKGNLYFANLVGGEIFRLEFVFQEIFAQVADGPVANGTFQSGIEIVNYSGTTATGALVFFNPDGTPHEIGLEGMTDSAFPVTVPGHSSVRFSTPGTSDPFYSGWAGLQSDIPLAGSVLFTFADSTTGEIEQAGVEGSELGKEFASSVVRSLESGLNSGIAVANPTFDEVNLVATILDGDGNPIFQSEFTLPPFQRRASFIDELGELPANFEGFVRLTADRAFAPTLIRTIHGLPSAGIPLGN